MPWTIYSRRPATSAAAKALIENPQLSDAALAIEASTSPTTIASTRARLEQVGVIERVEPASRLSRPRPQQPPSPTALAIAILGPQATPRAIADAAGVSLQAAWKALRKVNPPLADAAAATDQLSVTITADTRSIPDSAAATDAIAISKELDHADVAAAMDALKTTAEAICERCGGTFTFTPRCNAPPRLYCGQGCKRAGSGAAASYPPAILSLPAAPDFAKGLCTKVPASQRTWWTSSETALREAARSICEVCPILFPCAEYALSLPVTDKAIYGAMSTHQRLALKREMRRR